MNNQTVTQASNYFDLQGLEQLRQKTKTNDKETIREVANQFESMFATMLIKSMREANAAFETESPFNNQQTKFYTDMQDKQLAVDISRHGSLGLADALVRQLDPSSMVRQPAISEDKLNMPNQATNMMGLTPKKIMFDLHSEKAVQALKNPDQMKASTQAQISAEALNKSNKSNTEAASDFSSPKSFIETLLPYAKQAAKSLGVSAEVLIAQSALETGWGKKILQKADKQSSFNLFNIKSHKNWQGESVNKSSLEIEGGVGVQRQSNFRVYQGLQESFNDYTQFISTNQRYEQALQQGNNAERYIEELQHAGYATDPQYADKIKKIMNSDSFKTVVTGDNNG